MANMEDDRNYGTKNTSDKIAVIGELEHIRRHALRSMGSDDIPQEDRIFYAVVAKRAQDLRRKYMEENFPKCPEALWCLGKATASLRQLSYESFDGQDIRLKELDELVDMVWEKITGEDLSNCAACREDKEA